MGQSWWSLQSCQLPRALLRDRSHLQVAVNYSIFVEVLHCCQDLVDHHTCVFLGVNAPFQNSVKQLSPRYPVEMVVQKEKDWKKKKRLNKANHAFVLGQLIFWSFYNSTYSRTVPWVAVFVRLRLMDALECNFRVSVSITGKPREFGYGYKATTPSRSEPQASTTAGRIQKLHKRVYVFVWLLPLAKFAS